MGYEIIEANGLFELPCREWHQKTIATDRTAFTKFKIHFRTANTGRKSTATTGTSGCNGTANQAEITAEPTQAEIIATAVKAAVESASQREKSHQPTPTRLTDESARQSM